MKSLRGSLKTASQRRESHDVAVACITTRHVWLGTGASFMRREPEFIAQVITPRLALQVFKVTVESILKADGSTTTTSSQSGHTDAASVHMVLG